MNPGDQLPSLALPPVDRTMLALFAAASGDHNPIHINADFARGAGLPDVVAHGMLGMAWLGRLLTQWTPQERLRRFEVRFGGMVQLGEAIRCGGEVVELLVLDGEPCARVMLSADNEHGENRIIGEAIVALS